jgi:hypothetical protein
MQVVAAISCAPSVLDPLFTEFLGLRPISVNLIALVSDEHHRPGASGLTLTRRDFRTQPWRFNLVLTPGADLKKRRPEGAVEAVPQACSG